MIPFLSTKTATLALFLLKGVGTCAFVAPHNGKIRSIQESSSSLFGKRMKFQPPPKVVPQTEYIKVQADGEDAWRTMDVVEILDKGGLGVLPTDSGYCLVTPLSSKAGLERLFRVQNIEGYEAPVRVLCSDIATIDEFCYNIDKTAFKILKKNLPGLYTFILPAKNTLPKGIVEGRKQFQTVGVRKPDDPIVRYLQDELLEGMPLLISALGDEDDDASTQQLQECLVDEEAAWRNEVDFIVDAGARPQQASTIYDLTRRGEPTLVKEGMGELELAL